VEDASERLLRALEAWESAIELATPDEAVGTFDEASLQVFWQRWPHVSSWGGAVWRRSTRTGDAAKLPADSEHRDVGGEGDRGEAWRR
jgi:hypothetical protein